MFVMPQLKIKNYQMLPLITDENDNNLPLRTRQTPAFAEDEETRNKNMLCQIYYSRPFFRNKSILLN